MLPRFPLSPDADGYQDLLRAVEAVERVAERYHTRIVLEAPQEADSPCATTEMDAAYVGRLDAAAMILRSCLQEEA